MTKWHQQYKSSNQLSAIECKFYDVFESVKDFEEFMMWIHGDRYKNYQLTSNKPTLSDVHKWHIYNLQEENSMQDLDKIIKKNSELITDNIKLKFKVKRLSSKIKWFWVIYTLTFVLLFTLYTIK